MSKGFKAHILRPNVLDVAIAFIMATFLWSVAGAFTGGILLPLIAPDLAQASAGVGSRVIDYGVFLVTVVQALIVGGAVFVVWKAASGATKACEFCKSDIAIDATRCPNCTSQLSGASA